MFFTSINTPRTILAEKDDRKRGELALKIFFNYSKKNYPSTFKWSFEELLKKLDTKNKSFISGFGLGIKFTNASDKRIRTAMERVGALSQGNIPKNSQVFTNSLQSSLQSFDTEAFSEVAKMTIADTKELTEKAVAGYTFYKIAGLVIPIVLFFLSNRKKA